MNKSNKNGKPVWEDVTPDDLLTNELFHEVVYNEDYQMVFHSNLGSITVLDRLTGFGWRDTETGFRDMGGKFWLASGNMNVIDTCQGESIGIAIDWIKANANTCVGV